MKIMILCILIVILIFVIIERKLFKKINYIMFYLENKYYGNNSLIEIKHNRLNELIKLKESFAVFIHQSFCSTSYEFNKVLIKFADENKISFYKISFEQMKKTELFNKIKYYPSFAIYNRGKLIDYLKADKNKDLDYYKTLEKFKKWFSQYVTLERLEE